jgi:hypothetical protein
MENNRGIQDNSEFFIVGSVLSGTTLLRNILREHPRLISPEETHVFRWGNPFATEEYTQLYTHADTLQLHRKIDGINDKKFSEILEYSVDRKSFMQNYFKAFKESKGKANVRCFDKSPQNVYGMVMIKAYFPNAKFIHIIRNPLNVIASILKGHPGLSQNLLGAINYWKEAVLIMQTLKQCWSDAIYEFKYEDLCQQPQQEMASLLSFLKEESYGFETIKEIHQTDDNYKTFLSAAQIKQVKIELGQLMQVYGYLD